MISESTKANLIHTKGVEAIQWISQLPDLVQVYQRRWGFEIAEAFPGSKTAYVARVSIRGQQAVFKLIPPLGRGHL